MYAICLSHGASFPLTSHAIVLTLKIALVLFYPTDRQIFIP